MIDPVANTRITNNPFVADGDVDAIPNAVLAPENRRGLMASRPTPDTRMKLPSCPTRGAKRNQRRQAARAVEAAVPAR